MKQLKVVKFFLGSTALNVLRKVTLWEKKVTLWSF